MQTCIFYLNNNDSLIAKITTLVTANFFKMKSILLKIVLLLFLFTINSCKVNQTRDKVKVGRWIYSDTVNNISYKTTGKYKNGIEKKRWFYYANNKIIKKEKGDPRGIKYTIKGLGTDLATPIGVVGRLKETGVFLIITVYKIT